MIAAVSTKSDPYEGLANYFLGGRGGEYLGVKRALPSSPQLLSRPGAQPSTGKRPLPSSSQRPWQPTNQRIPYPRFMFTWPQDTAAPRELQDGDVVFALRSSQAMGYGYNRSIKATGISQLNAMLSDKKPGYSMLDLTSSNVRERIKEGRIDWNRGEVTKARAHLGDTEEKVRMGYKEAEAALVAAKAALAAAEAALKASKALNPAGIELKDLDVRKDWRAVPLFDAWSLDGVLINVDDDALDVDTPRDARDDGVLLNVCVAGPTQTRNTRWESEKQHTASAMNTQMIDNGILPLDNVFVGIFAYNERESTGKGGAISTKGWYFSLRLFSSRQILAVGMLGGRINRPLPPRIYTYTPTPFGQGPSPQDFERLIGAWRLGSVMDTNLKNMLMINVVVEWWELSRLQAQFGDEIGTSKDLDTTTSVLPTTVPGVSNVLLEEAIMKCDLLRLAVQEMEFLQDILEGELEKDGATIEEALSAFEDWVDSGVEKQPPSKTKKLVLALWKGVEDPSPAFDLLGESVEANDLRGWARVIVSEAKAEDPCLKTATQFVELSSLLGRVLAFRDAQFENMSLIPFLESGV